jgi:hypothetical protein
MNTDGIAYLFFFKNWKYFIFQIELIALNGLQLKEVAGFPENVSAEKYFPFTTNFSLEHNAANFF